MDDLDDLGDKELIQSALRGDFELIAGYGEEHPGAWTGAWFDNEPTVRIVAAFTGDAARHDAALRPRLRYPDRLVVESRQLSLCGLRRVREEIERALEQRAAEAGRWILTSIGEGAGVICVALRADQETLASELADRYGSAVELRVGWFSFPDRRRSHPRPPAGTAALQEQTFEGLEMSVEAGQKVLEVGDDGHGRPVLRNSGSERIGPLGSGQPLAGSLLNASLEAVGGYGGWIAGTGLIMDLAPGRSASIPVIYGTASTREDLGYVVPPGRYWLQVQMRFRRGLGGPPTNTLTAPLTQITIIPRVRPLSRYQRLNRNAARLGHRSAGDSSYPENPNTAIQQRQMAAQNHTDRRLRARIDAAVGAYHRTQISRFGAASAPFLRGAVEIG